ncbi:fungal-specific transcription factor domain-containing protein [Emericellopsis atlantica]|uniref:Fungal-specific transcription factor domain-containing protein n=1 Tax=Emericellopsis atlantica TaxID=2614577 RepID=A0A9P7ZJC7_9HYPO|nr:fungal-specific transcription factor domain-containing protein [Emericellopsis atlantica]KAG9253001.1 fungal-specific transcription factor domain-containing protein [Emericellopsis atlantica]
MECKWRPQTRPSTQRRPSQPPTQSPMTDVSPGGPGSAGQQAPHAVDEVFDYASFMWEGGDFWQQVSPEMGSNVGLNTHIMGTDAQLRFPNMVAPAPVTYGTPAMRSNGSAADKPVVNLTGDKLMEFFATSANPPILEEVETQKKWVLMRQTVVDMAKHSRMLHCAILAFSAILVGRRDRSLVVSEENHYESAVARVVEYDQQSLVEHSSERECLLAALFFLAYVDILEMKLDAGHSHLQRAYKIFQRCDKKSFGALEKQILLWLRLLDGKAVSAGGDGLFLSKADELFLVEASPGSFDGGDTDDLSRQEPAEGDIEDVLFQVLYQPGVVFYQKVQSFMGRISKIDPWHRSRGTVEDETEVMNIGASIATDLRNLYDHRPPLMDFAVAGKLQQPHVSAHLAFVITRAFRTYLSNYYASKVHLHRVAYKTLPLTKEAIDALDNIRRLVRQMVNEMDTEDSLPINMLWPLLMLGAEEQDMGERAWIKETILRMERVAGNARITAQVLEEVQARQDTAKARMDIRSVMLTVFNACFAIV